MCDRWKKNGFIENLFEVWCHVFVSQACKAYNDTWLYTWIDLNKPGIVWNKPKLRFWGGGVTYLILSYSDFHQNVLLYLFDVSYWYGFSIYWPIDFFSLAFFNTKFIAKELKHTESEFENILSKMEKQCYL